MGVYDATSSSWKRELSAPKGKDVFLKCNKKETIFLLCLKQLKVTTKPRTYLESKLELEWINF